MLEFCGGLLVLLFCFTGMKQIQRTQLPAEQKQPEAGILTNKILDNSVIDGHHISQTTVRHTSLSLSPVLS